MNDISVVLNVYKRPETLESQIDSVLNQSVEIKPENIHVWYNESGVIQHKPKDSRIKTYQCNWNTKFFGRFTIPLLCRTPYIAMFDDDILPQKDWFRNCLDSMSEIEGIYGGSGVIQRGKSYIPNYKVGWNGLNSNKIERVDLVGHAWFFKQEWTKYLFYEKPFTWDNGEDIMFSYLAQKYGGIDTYVPPHPLDNKNLWSCDAEYGVRVGSDENSSWKKSDHLDLRNQVSIHCINNGWETVSNN